MAGMESWRIGVFGNTRLFHGIQRDVHYKHCSCVVCRHLVQYPHTVRALGHSRAAMCSGQYNNNNTYTQEARSTADKGATTAEENGGSGSSGGDCWCCSIAAPMNVLWCIFHVEKLRLQLQIGKL